MERFYVFGTMPPSLTFYLEEKQEVWGPFCLARDAYPGGKRGSCPFLSSSMGEGGPKIALRTEFFPSLQSAEGAFSGIVDCLVLENLPGGKPADSQINIFLLGD